MPAADSTDSGRSTVRDSVASRAAARRFAVHGTKDALPGTASWPGTVSGPVIATTTSSVRREWMAVVRNYLISGTIAAAIHATVFLAFNGGDGPPPAAAAEPEEPFVALEMPVLEPPDSIEIVDVTDAPATPQMSAPMLMDMPSAVVVSNFVQPLQPMLDPSLTSVGAFTIPSSAPSFGAGGAVRLFELKELDRVPRRVRTVMPVYPHELRRAGVKGEVVLLVIIDSSGHVEVERVISSTNREFEAAAVKAAEQCMFESPLRAGQRVNARYTWHIPFEIK